jgi:hypothetical protein
VKIPAEREDGLLPCDLYEDIDILFRIFPFKPPSSLVHSMMIVACFGASRLHGTSFCFNLRKILRYPSMIALANGFGGSDHWTVSFPLGFEQRIRCKEDAVNVWAFDLVGIGMMLSELGWVSTYRYRWKDIMGLVTTRHAGPRREGCVLMRVVGRGCFCGWLASGRLVWKEVRVHVVISGDRRWDVGVWIKLAWTITDLSACRGRANPGKDFAERPRKRVR